MIENTCTGKQVIIDLPAFVGLGLMISGVGCGFSGTVAMVICCCIFCTTGCMLLTAAAAAVVAVNAEPLEGARDVVDWTGLMIVMLLVALGASWVTWDRKGPVA